MIVAEIGQNFCADITLAEYLLRLAHANGADMAKFQLYEHKKLYKDYPKMVDSSLSYEQAKHLFDYGNKIGIEVFFSVFDTERIKWCEQIGVKRYKIAYGMRNLNVVEAVVNTGKPIISSYKINVPMAQTLYCIPHYPTELSELGLGSVDFQKDYQGFSDHTIGTQASKVAIARGASIIEKHFCLRHSVGVDGAWSMDAGELRGIAEWEKVCLQSL